MIKSRCERIVFVHVQLFGKDGKRLPDDWTVFAAGECVSAIVRRGEADIQGTDRVVMGLDRFLITAPFRPEEVMSANTIDLVTKYVAETSGG